MSHYSVKRKHEDIEKNREQSAEDKEKCNEEHDSSKYKYNKTENDVQSSTAKSESAEDVVLFFVQEGIQGKRYQLMKNFALKNGFACEDSLSERVTHVVSELDSVSQINKLYPQLSLNYQVKIVKSQWMYICVRQKTLVSVDDFLVMGYQQWRAESMYKAHGSSSREKKSEEQDKSTANIDEQDKKLFNDNVLERKAKLEHQNMKLVEPLAFMHDYWTVMGDERRALAYAKAAATIKCLPFTVTTIEEIEKLKGLGTGHSLKVVREFLRTGGCKEVTVKAESEKYIGLKNLTKIYGIGAGLAEKLYTLHNLRSVQDLITKWNELKLGDERIKYGTAYYNDLNTPVTREQAGEIESFVKGELDIIKPGYTLEITGGFRRGKNVGHDVDFLITYQKDGEEVGILTKLLIHLSRKGYILHQKVEKSTYDEEMVFKRGSDKVNPMDYFEKCFCIFRLPLCYPWPSSEATDVEKDFESLLKDGERQRSWQAVRVDFVFVPQSQWPYALVGWTGSKLYMRLLRHYSNKYLHMLLNSHGLWSKADNALVPAKNEAEVFKNLGLSYKDPSDRNF